MYNYPSRNEAKEKHSLLTERFDYIFYVAGLFIHTFEIKSNLIPELNFSIRFGLEINLIIIGLKL